MCIRDRIVKAVQEGRLDEAVLDEAVERVLNVVFAGEEQHRPEDISDKETDHKKAADIETECAVLLENNGILPLNTDRKVAYIGEFAEKPRYQGGGSSHINPFRVVSALDAAGEKGRSVTYAKACLLYTSRFSPSYILEKNRLLLVTSHVSSVPIISCVPSSYSRCTSTSSCLLYTSGGSRGGKCIRSDR